MAKPGRPRSFRADEVVEASRDVFWQHGYRATSLRDLGQQLGVLPGSLYNAFGDKRALFAAGLDLYREEERRATAALIADGAVLPRLREFLVDVLRAAADSPGRGCLLGNTAIESLPGDDPVAAAVRRGFRELEDALALALATARDRGEIGHDLDIRDQARLLLALMQGLHVVARAEDDPMALSGAIDAALAPLAAQARRGR